MPQEKTLAERAPKAEAPIEKKKGVDLFRDFDKSVRGDILAAQMKRSVEEEQIQDEVLSHKEVVEGLSGFDAFSVEPQQALFNAEALIAWLEEGKQKGLKLGRDFTTAKARFDRLQEMHVQYRERRETLLEATPELVARLDQYFFSAPEVVNLSKQVVSELREFAIELYKGGQEEAEKRAVEAFSRTEAAEAYFAKYNELAKPYEVAPDTEEMARAQFQNRIRESVAAASPQMIEKLVKELEKEKQALAKAQGRKQEDYIKQKEISEWIRKAEGRLMDTRAELYIADLMVERVQKLLENEIQDPDTRRAIFEQMPVSGRAFRTEEQVGLRANGSEQMLASASVDLKKKLMLELWRTAFLISWANGDAQIGLNGLKTNRLYGTKPLGTDSASYFSTYPIAVTGSEVAVDESSLRIQGSFAKEVRGDELKSLLSSACEQDESLYGELVALARAKANRDFHVEDRGEKIKDLGRSNSHYKSITALGQSMNDGEFLYRPAHRELDLRVQKEALRRLETPVTEAELTDVHRAKGLILTAEQGAEAAHRVQREALLAIAETERVKRELNSRLQSITSQLTGLEQAKTIVSSQLEQVTTRAKASDEEIQQRYAKAIGDAQERAREKDQKIAKYEQEITQGKTTDIRTRHEIDELNKKFERAESMRVASEEQVQYILKAIEEASTASGMLSGDLKKRLATIIAQNRAEHR